MFLLEKTHNGCTELDTVLINPCIYLYLYIYLQSGWLLKTQSYFLTVCLTILVLEKLEIWSQGINFNIKNRLALVNSSGNVTTRILREFSATIKVNSKTVVQ